LRTLLLEAVLFTRAFQVFSFFSRFILAFFLWCSLFSAFLSSQDTILPALETNNIDLNDFCADLLDFFHDFKDLVQPMEETSRERHPEQAPHTIDKEQDDGDNGSDENASETDYADHLLKFTPTPRIRNATSRFRTSPRNTSSSVSPRPVGKVHDVEAKERPLIQEGPTASKSRESSPSGSPRSGLVLFVTAAFFCLKCGRILPCVLDMCENRSSAHRLSPSRSFPLTPRAVTAQRDLPTEKVGTGDIVENDELDKIARICVYVLTTLGNLAQF